MDCSLPGFSVHGIFQARVLERVAISSSRGSSWPRNQTHVSCVGGRCFTFWATREALHGEVKVKSGCYPDLSLEWSTAQTESTGQPGDQQTRDHAPVGDLLRKGWLWPSLEEADARVRGAHTPSRGAGHLIVHVHLERCWLKAKQGSRQQTDITGPGRNRFLNKIYVFSICLALLRRNFLRVETLSLWALGNCEQQHQSYSYQFGLIIIGTLE